MNTDFNRKSNEYIGKLRFGFSSINSSFLPRSNFLGTEFQIFDRGENPSKALTLEETRKQLGVVIYVHHFQAF